jgi:hypothetical protein
VWVPSRARQFPDRARPSTPPPFFPLIVEGWVLAAVFRTTSDVASCWDPPLLGGVTCIPAYVYWSTTGLSSQGTTPPLRVRRHSARCMSKQSVPTFRNATILCPNFSAVRCDAVYVFTETEKMFLLIPSGPRTGCHGFIHHAGSKLENYANTVRARKQAPRPGASLGEASARPYSVDIVHTVKVTTLAVGRHARR